MAPGDGREVSADVESLVGGWGEREMRGREEKGEKKGGESDRHSTYKEDEKEGIPEVPQSDDPISVLRNELEGPEGAIKVRMNG